MFKLSDQVIFDSTISCTGSLLYISKEGILFLNDNALFSTPLGYPKFYPSSSDLFTISSNSALKVFDAEKNECIYSYKDSYLDHVYSKDNIINAITPDGLRQYDLRIRHSINLIKQVGIQKIKNICNKIYYCTINEIEEVIADNKHVFYDYYNILDFTVLNGQPGIFFWEEDKKKYIKYGNRVMECKSTNISSNDEFIYYYKKNNIYTLSNTVDNKIQLENFKEISHLKYLNNKDFYLSVDGSTYFVD